MKNIKNKYSSIDYNITVKKSNNDVDKHSFVLFLEAVNNVYNQTLQDERNSRTS